jgi:hypothetical protein
MFTHRLDYAIGPPLDPAATVTVQALNRFYDPTLGRWLQRDPIATGQVILLALSSNGETLRAFYDAIDVDAHYIDGMNIFQFVRSNPVNFRDPQGTFLPVLGAALFQGVVGGIISGIVSVYMEGSFFEGFASGFVGGVVGGAAGAAVNAFASSLTGLIGTLASHALVGAADGFAGGFTQSYHANGDFGGALSDGLFGAAVGAATAGLVDWGGKAFRGLRVKAVLPQGVAPNKIKGPWPAAWGRDGRVFVHHHHAAAMEAASEGRGIIPGIKSGWVELDENGEIVRVISQD